MPSRQATRVQGQVQAALDGRDRIVLAVSGGLDSMALLDAAAATIPRERLVVATFDHGTGPVARDASALVTSRSAELGLTAIAGRSDVAPRGEAALRAARWTFLRDTARRHRAVVATAHTEDDQVETVLMRIMRGSGARGIAGMYGPGNVVRPFIGIRRSELAAYVRSRELAFIDDPSNVSRQYLRNRLRADLLPALRAVRPAIDAELIALASRAADWRAEVDALVDRLVPPRADSAGVDLPADALRAPIDQVARLVWPAVAARAGLVLDRRGLDRLADFSARARTGARIQLSGGWQVVRSRDAFQLRRIDAGEPAPAPLGRSEDTAWGAWTFRAGIADQSKENPWCAILPADAPLMVRAWRPGDTMVARAGGGMRKVKALLSGAGVTGHQRTTWPVVTAGDEIVWIPGVRRGGAATARSGRPGLPFHCEYNHR